MRRSIAIVAFVATAVMASGAFASESEKGPQVPLASAPTPSDLFREGLAEYDAEHFPRAIELFTKAYEQTKAPGLLFNIAQAWRLLGECKKAVAMYQTFISDVDARDFSASALEQAWRVVDDTFQVLTAQHFPPTKLSWIFERAALHCVQRPDGAILGIFLARKNVEVDTVALTRLLAEFQGLALGDSAPAVGS